MLHVQSMHFKEKESKRQRGKDMHGEIRKNGAKSKLKETEACRTWGIKDDMLLPPGDKIPPLWLRHAWSVDHEGIKGKLKQTEKGTFLGAWKN